MGTLTFPGLATGIDTNEIIEQLMAVESQKLARYQVELEELDEQLTALEAVQDAAETLQATAEDLADPDELISYNSTSTDDGVVSVSVDDDAEAGSHTIIVNQLATSETWIQDVSDYSYTSEYVGEGTFIYSYNYQECVITTTSTTTLEDFVELINNDEDNPGVTASLLYQGDTYHLVLTGTETGEDYQITINDTSTEVWRSDTTLTEDEENADMDTELYDLDQWSGFLTGDEYITISGTDHDGNAIEPEYTIDVSTSTTLDELISEINSYFDGVAYAQLTNGKIVLTDMTSGESQFSISLTYNDADGSGDLDLGTMTLKTEGGAKTASLESMDASTFVETQDAQNAEIQVDGYTPTATAEAQTITTDTAATGGTFTLTYNGETTAAIAYDATAEEIAAAINALDSTSELGDVTVSGTMTDGTVEITFDSEDGNVRPLTIDISNLSGTTEATVEETERGSNDIWITRNSNTISDAISGITLSLVDTNDIDDDTDEIIEVTITVSRDTDAVAEKITSFVDAYNSLIELLEEYCEYDDDTEEMGVLSDDVALGLIESQLKSVIQTWATGFTSDDEYQEASDIGLDYDSDGILELDEDDFNDAIEDDYMAVINLLSAVASGDSDSDVIKFSTSSELYTEPGTYEVIVEVDDSGNVTSAQISYEGEGYNDMEISDNLISGQSEFDDSGNSLYAENGLYLEVDTTTAGTYTATITVKEGIFTTLNGILEDLTDTDGTLEISIETVEDEMDDLADDIDDENDRLDTREQALVEKYARLEATLSDLQNQLSSVTSVLG